MIEPVKITIEQVQTALEIPQQAIDEYYPDGWFTSPPKPAAILIPILELSDGLHILYIRRTSIDGDIHSGQVAFPGGGAEKSDRNPEMTALRETVEEIGVDPKHITLLGKLGTLKTISNFSITPIVARLDWPIAVIPSPSEVSRIFTIPLTWLANPANRYIKVRALPDPYPSLNVIYFLPYDGETLWGASAKITVRLLEVLGLAEK